MYALLVAILAVGAWLRFDGRNWDDFTHLHPDERFLTDVVSLLNGPLSFSDSDPTVAEQHRLRCEARYPAQPIDPDDPDTFLSAQSEAGRGGYFDADCSPLNPNNLGKGLYVYGEFPLFTVHFAGWRPRTSRGTGTASSKPSTRIGCHRVTAVWETCVGAQLVRRASRQQRTA